MAIIGLDIHRSFAQAAFLRDGQIIREQRVDSVAIDSSSSQSRCRSRTRSFSRPLATAQPSSGSCGPWSGG